VPIGAGFAVALVLEGDGVFSGSDEFPFRAGQVFAVPAGFGAWEVRGPGSVLVATPGAGWPRSLAEGGIA
jgi:mannose-6-phosphate isomerase